LKKIITYCLFLLTANIWGQTTYKMSNNSVADCRGIFTGSEENKAIAGNYDHNEDYTFTICVPGAAKITITFSNINTEAQADTIFLFDGNNISKPLISKYAGNHNNVVVSSTGNCITVRFKSDASISGTGWNATWESKITTVANPKFSPITNPTCNSTSIDITLDKKFNCDSIKGANFGLSGPNAPSISSATGLNCDGNNMADQFRVNFASGLIRSGTYKITFQAKFKDACDSIWILKDSINFRVTDCPIEVKLSLDNTPICRGTCTRIRAVVTGGDSTKYVYNWTPTSLSGKGPITICPNSTTQYKLTVTDGTSVPGKDSITLDVVDPPVAQNDTLVCISSAPFNLSATPLGGTWSGTGITNGTNGTFSPAVAGGGAKTISYTISGCKDDVIVTVRSVTAGGAIAACPGSGVIALTGGNPAGGVWSGTNVDASGNYTVPVVPGSYQVTYTWNGCSANKTINVDNIKITSKPDSMCYKDDSLNILFTPFGGTWSGTGITQNRIGTFKPAVSGVGHKAIRYSINGCQLDTYIYVKYIDARWDELFCPEQNIVTFPAGLPAGGLWSGKGIVDAINGNWDLKYQTGHPIWGYNDTAWYSQGGCTDFKLLYVRPTVILNDSINRCIETPAFVLNWNNVQVTPWSGIWSGPGVQSNGNFTAANAGYGLHKLFYTVNGCVDSLLINIYDKSIIQNDTSLCITEPAFTLYKGQTGGTWSGKGVTNGISGIYSPIAAGVGNHVVKYTSKNGCIDSLTVTINAKPVINLSGLQGFYCFKDTNLTINYSPIGGVFTGTPLNGDKFNPQLAGKGNASITYTYGTLNCQTSATITTIVGDTLKVTIDQDKDSICPGAGLNIVPKASGGTMNYSYNWDNGRTNAKDIYESPNASTFYILEVTDGCSNPAIDTAFVGLYPAISGTFNTSEKQCYGTKGWAKVTPLPASPNYVFDWNTSPVSRIDSIYQTVGIRYRVNVVNIQTGCYWNGDVTIPGYEKVKADFTSLPRFPACLSNLKPDLYLIDYSEGGISGYWDFGDGTKIPYKSGQNPTHTYVPDTNAFTVKLVIQNEGGCTDSAFLPICLVDTVLIYVPNAFSPAKIDGINDIFKPSVAGVTEYKLEIFNRWGQKLFETEDPLKGWDGKVNGNLLATDYYHYVMSYKGKKTARKFHTGVIFLID